MAWFEREFIAVPEDRKNHIVYKWPDLNIRRYSRAMVNSDEVAVFVRSGRVLATMGPGRHRIDAEELPVLGALIDSMTGGNYYRAELYFVSTREFAGLKFGGRLADIVDPATEQVVTLRVFGEFALTVRDPSELLSTLTGSTDLADPNAVQNWAGDLLMRSMKMAATRGISAGEWPIMGLSGHLDAIEGAAVRQANLTLYQYGLRIARLGNFDITLAPEDAERLKRLAKDRTYIRLTGDFQRYAAGELALGAGEGLSKGGDTGMLGAAMGLQPLMHSAMPAYPAAISAGPTAPSAACGSCGHTENPVTARFCVNCGDRMGTPNTPVTRHCHACGGTLAPESRFCGACGTKVAPD